MSALGAWALLILLFIVAAAVVDTLRVTSPDALRRVISLDPPASLVQCPGRACTRLLAPGEHCPEHDVHAPLRTGSVVRDRA